MKALVVYESLWGNTAAVARAIAEGIGEGAIACTTAEADAAALEGVDLLVCGSPVLVFSLPTEAMRDGIRQNPGPCPSPPDLSHPSMRAWLAALPEGTGACASFETRVNGPWGSAKPKIAKALKAAGYREVVKPEGFIVTGKYGPLKAGEIERARVWGAGVAAAGSAATGA